MAADGESAEKIVLVICQLRSVIARGTDSDVQPRQMLVARVHRACRRSSFPAGQ